jgi:radical SAM-linked protein
MEAKPKYRYRLTFSKGYQVKYVAHLDIVLTWTRAFRRANVPVAYTEGFNPQARIQVAASLPVGHMGSAELMDVYLIEPMEPTEILGRVSQTLPAGFELLAVEEVEPKNPALQSILIQADYKVIVETDLSETELAARLEGLLGAEEVLQTRVRRKKEETFNLRPLLHSLKLAGKTGSNVTLTMRLAAGSRGHLRPESIMEAMGLADTWYQIERTKLIFNI